MQTSATLAHRAVGALPSGGLSGVAARTQLDEAALHRAADLLYDGIEADRPLRRKFGADLVGERRKLGALFSEILGASTEWSSTYAFGDLAGPHRYIHITNEDAARWLGHAREAFAAVAGVEVARDVVSLLRPLAMSMVNEGEEAEAGARREARFAPTREASAAAGKGDVAAVVAILDAHRHVIAAGDPGSAEVLYAAVVKARLPVVRELIARGVDVNKPARAGFVMLTALCVARSRGRRGEAVAEALEDAGAVVDVFTSAYLGDLEDLTRALDREPALVNEPDPASDLFAATVVDHAVAGLDRAATLCLLAGRGARSPAHGHLLLRHAADAGDSDAVSQLLDLGAEARCVTPGRWVLNPECASLLLGAGTDVNHAPTRFASWIWQSCSGNRGAKDDPLLVRALLEAGADVHARAFGRTALHHAAKAAFPQTVALLLDAGADPLAVDDGGRTPAALALTARPSERRSAVLLALEERCDSRP